MVVAALGNDQARWSLLDPTSPYWEDYNEWLYREGMAIYILAPLRCPMCGRGMIWTLPVSEQIPPAELALLLEQRRVEGCNWPCPECDAEFQDWDQRGKAQISKALHGAE